jgi:periplasmic copper chaperone A
VRGLAPDERNCTWLCAVNWVDVATPNGPEPDHPAPVLTLTSGNDTAAPAATTAATTSKDDSDSAKTIAIIGLVVGGIALVLSGLSLATRRKSTATAQSQGS